MKKSIMTIAALVFFAGTVSFVGCSSSPEAVQLQQLNGLKEEYAAMQRDISSKSDQVASLNRDLEAKKAKLNKCSDDQRIVKEKLRK